MRKSELDLRICDCEDGATNTQTYREYIYESEFTFYGVYENLDGMSEGELNDYLDELDYLWTK